MYITTVGRVVKISQHIGGSNLTIVRVAHDNAGQIVEDGKYGHRETGYFDYAVWEDNLMVGTRSDFTKTIASLKPGATIEILADLVDRTTKEDGQVKERKIVFNALRISYVSTSRPTNGTRVEGTTEDAEFSEVKEDTEDVAGTEFAPDAFFG